MGASLTLVGQYDSPFVRRVAVSLRMLGFDYAHDTRSVFGDFDAMRALNPLGRIPTLVLEDGEVLIDSAAILDWLDQTVGPERALIPPAGPARRRALRRIALAVGVAEKTVALTYELALRPERYRWPAWQARCRIQVEAGLAALAAEPWADDGPLDQTRITTACTLRYVRMAQHDLLPAGRHPSLDALAERCEALPAFRATFPDDYTLPEG